MLPHRRHEHILGELRLHGSVRVRELADQLDVSDMTIRRDLEELAAQGRVDKVHGGAILPSTRTANEPGFEVSVQRRSDEKRAIAALAAELVEPGAAVALSAGSTTWMLAHQLLPVPGLTVLTNSPSVAAVFYADATVERSVVLTGGLRTPSDALVGPLATAALHDLKVDLTFLGVHGIDASGLSTPNLAEAEVNRALIECGNRLVVLADSSKWNRRGLARFAELGEADVVVSDGDLADDARAVLDDQPDLHVRLAVVPAGDRRTA